MSELLVSSVAWGKWLTSSDDDSAGGENDNSSPENTQ